MNLDKILSQVREKFSPRFPVDFKEEGLHFEFEPLTALEEAKILTALKDVEDVQYVAALKRHSLACAIKKINEMELGAEDIEYTDDDGSTKRKSKYLYMVDFLGGWPSPLIDMLFEVFSDMNREADAKVKQNAKFEKFVLSEKIADEIPKKFRPLNEASAAPLTAEERLEKKVEREIETANLQTAETSAEKIAEFEEKAKNAQR